MAGRQRPHQVQMHVRKTSSWDVDAWNRRLDVRLDLILLTAEAGSGPEANIFRKAGPHTAISWKHELQDVRVRGERRTIDGREKWEPEAVEIRRTHHSRWRMLGKEWKLRRGKGWITWIELMDIQIVMQGETKSQNWRRRGQWKRQRTLARRRQR